MNLPIAVLDTVKKNLTIILIFILSSLFPLFLILNIENVFGSPISPPDTPPDTPPDITIHPTSAPNNPPSDNNSPPKPPEPYCDKQPPTGAPSIFHVKRFKDSVNLTFVPATGNVTYYYIAYGTKVGDESYGVSFEQGYSPGALNFTISKLDPKKTYYFKIRGGNGCMPGPWSPWISTKGVKQSTIPLTNKTVNKPSVENIKNNQTGHPEVVLPQIPQEVVVPTQSTRSNTSFQSVPISQPERVELTKPKKSIWKKLLDFLGF